MDHGGDDRLSCIRVHLTHYRDACSTMNERIASDHRKYKENNNQNDMRLVNHCE